MSQGMTDSLFTGIAKTDLTQVRRYDHGLARLTTFATDHPGLFRVRSASSLEPDQKQELRRFWQLFLDYQLSLEQIRLRHSSFWKINPGAHRRSYALSFTVFYAAFLAQNLSGSRLIGLVGDAPQVEQFWNESGADSLPMAYSRLKFRVLNLMTFQMTSGGYSHFNDFTRPALSGGRDSLLEWAVAFQEAGADTLLRHAREKNLSLAFMNAPEVGRKQVFDLLFPLQKNLADFMGRTHYGLTGRPAFITPALVDSLHTLLEPGDIILVRRNWVLSNIGLPGFWPHAALYTGAPDEASAWFGSNSEVVKTLRERGQSADSGLFRTVEALSEGVVQNSLEKTCDADYVAVLRPRLSKNDKARAVLQALAYCGTPYDFDFDFNTDATLVCTELIYKAYQPRTGMEQGLMLPLCEILNRWTLPPNNFADIFAQERDTPGRCFDFVAFLDGNEKNKKARFRPESTFIESRQRVKWDFLQE